MIRAAIIAALESELRPLVKAWKQSTLAIDGKPFACYATDGAVALAGGIGSRRAESAARAVVQQFHPEMLISAGLAGALIRSLKVGNIVIPNVIVEAETRLEYRCDVGGEVIGGGVLVTASEIAGGDGKRELVERFHSLIVDMEAAGVARVAQEQGIGFRCVKAISDETDFAMPPLNQFVDEDGRFQQGRFVRWLTWHPQHWTRTLALGRNSTRASRALCEWLQQNLGGKLQPARVVTLKEAEYLKN